MRNYNSQFKHAKPATCFTNFSITKQPSTFEMICHCRSTYGGCNLIPGVASSMSDFGSIFYKKIGFHLPIMYWATLEHTHTVAIYRYVTKGVTSCASTSVFMGISP